jgi:hypothetical protein
MKIRCSLRATTGESCAPQEGQRGTFSRSCRRPDDDVLVDKQPLWLSAEAPHGPGPAGGGQGSEESGSEVYHTAPMLIRIPNPEPNRRTFEPRTSTLRETIGSGRPGPFRVLDVARDDLRLERGRGANRQIGARAQTRTGGLPLRRRMLYPPELHALMGRKTCNSLRPESAARQLTDPRDGSGQAVQNKDHHVKRRPPAFDETDGFTR